MNTVSRTEVEINQWHKNFEQIREQWQAWLMVNFSHYQSTKEAWTAFEAQQQGHSLIPRIKALH